MKTAELKATVTGNISFTRRVKMGIHPKALAPILNHLISMYTEPYKAVLREYTSNARDAHRDAGTKRPVEVTLPSTFDPNLTIQDWGVGMDADELAAYGQFGLTTKDDSDDAIGGYGLGSKSALAIASSFNVISIKDGKKNTAIIFRDEDGAPDLGMLDEVETSEPNGTKVIIPTSEIARLTEAASMLFVAWERGTIVIDDEEPRYSVSDEQTFRKIGDAGWMLLDDAALKLPTSEYGGLASIAGVTVPLVWREIDRDLHSRLRDGILRRLILNVDNGSVELLRSREALAYKDSTIAVLKAKLEQVLDVSRAEYQTMIDAAPDVRAAWKIAQNAEAAGFKGSYTYKKLSLEFDYSGMDKLTDEQKVLTQVHINSSEKIDRVSLTINPVPLTAVLHRTKAILITEALTPENKGKKYYSPKWLHPESRTAATFLREHLRKPDGSTNPWGAYVFYTSLSSKVALKLFKGIFTEVLTADDYAATLTQARKTAAAQARATRLAAGPKEKGIPARVLVHGYQGTGFGQETTLDKLDTSETYILLKSEGTTYPKTIEGKLHRGLTTKVGFEDESHLVNHFYEYVIKKGTHKILLANSSWDTSKYADQIKLATVTEALQVVVDKISPKFTPTQLRSIADRTSYDYNWATRWSANDIAEVLDEDLREWLTAMSDDTITKRWDEVQRAQKIASYFPGVKAVEAPTTTKGERPTAKYPMLAKVRYADPDILTEYVNTVYLFNL